MKNYYVTLLLLNCFNIFAQLPSIEWQKTLGGSGTDLLKSVAEKNNNFILAGFSNSPISGNKTSVNSSTSFNDIWTISLNTSGAINWQNAYTHSMPPNLLQDNLATLHFFDGSFFFGVTYDEFDVFMSRIHQFNENGSYQNLVFPGKDLNCVGTIPSNYDVVTTDYFKTNDGNYIYSGTNGNISPTCSNHQINYYIAKSASLSYNSVIWDSEFSGSANDILAATIETSDNGFLLIGASNSNIGNDKTENSKGDFDYWIIKTDNLGAITWQKTIGGSGKDEPKTVIQTPDGGYLIAGSSNSNTSGDKTENSKGGFDYWLVKLDSNGTVLWNKTIGGNQDDLFSKMIATNDGGYLLLGSSKSGISNDKTEDSRGLFDNWMVKINATGAVLWDKTIGGNLNDFGYDILQTSDSGFLMASTSNSEISGEKTEGSFGEKDYWVVKFSPENLAAFEHQNNASIEIAPNPTSGNFTVNFGTLQNNISVTVTNLLGQVITKSNFNAVTAVEMELQTEAGMYLVTVETENHQKSTFKIVKN